VAGAVAEEKENKTLEFLLATDLRNREIVLSKLAARLANVTLIVLAGLPVLSAVQFLGGVDPDLLLASFAIVGLTMLSLASLSIACSVRARRARDAIVFTYLGAILYPTLGFVALGLLKMAQWLVLKDPYWAEALGSVVQVVEVPIEVFNSGNLIWLFIQLIQTLQMGGNVGDPLPSLLRDYAIFHGVVAFACSGWAVARLRVIALRETEVRKAARRGALRDRPAVGDTPMMWKEIHAEPKMRFGWLGRGLLGILMISSFLPAWYILMEDRSYAWGRDYLGREMNVWVRIVGTAVACLMLLAVAVRSAGSISGERDKQTLDTLLTSPLETKSILYAKWVGSILSVRWAWLWLGFIWLIGLASGGLNPCGLPLVVAAWFVYAGTFAAIGLWFSVVCRTTLRATLSTLLTALLVGGGHWFLSAMCCFLPVELLMRGSSRDVEHIAYFQFGQTPPLVMGLLAFHGDEFRHVGWREQEIAFFSFFGLICWAVGAALVGAATHARFQILTGRERVPRPYIRAESLPET
jgi:ABC-type transport system involved in multi-copper enzyme maturation permease subunit